VGKPRTRCEGVIRRDTSQILGIRGWRRRAEDREEWRRLLKRPGPRRGCSALAGFEVEYYDIVLHFVARLAEDTTFVGSNKKGSLVTI